MNKSLGDIYRNTFSFCLLKLAFGGMVTLLCLLLFILFFSIGVSMGEDMVGLFLFIWIVVSAALIYMSDYYFGYLFKAGHMAAAADYVKTSMVPDSAYQYSILRIRKRFSNTQEYHRIEKLVHDSLRDFYGVIEKMSANPPHGFDAVFSVLTGIPLSYIGSCCISYAFYFDRSNIFKSIAEGTAIFPLEHGRLLKNSRFVTIISLISVILTFAVTFTVSLLIFNAIGSTAPYALVIALMFAILFTKLIKNSFIDTFILISDMCTYFYVMPAAKGKLTYGLFGKLCSYSRAFRELYATGRSNQGYTQQIDIIPDHLVMPDAGSDNN